MNCLQNEETGERGQLCRLCANNIKVGVYIFNDAGEEQHLAHKINTCLPVTVSTKTAHKYYSYLNNSINKFGSMNLNF